MAKARIGRPPHYTDSQVLAAVASIETIGGMPTGEAVKKVLIEEHDVSDGINAQSLADRVSALVEARDRDRRTERLMALPPEARQGAKALAVEMERRALDCMADAYDGMRTTAAEVAVARDADLRIVRQHVAGLEAAAVEHASERTTSEAETARLTDALEATTALLNTAQGTVAALEAEIAVLRRDQLGRDGMLALLREALEEKTASGRVTAPPGAGARNGAAAP